MLCKNITMKFQETINYIRQYKCLDLRASEQQIKRRNGDSKVNILYFAFEYEKRMTYNLQSNTIQLAVIN